MRAYLTDAVEWSRKNRKVGRPFIEHQLEIMDFYVGLQCAARARADVQLMHREQLLAIFPDQRIVARNPFVLRVTLSHRGVMHEIGLVPDLVLGLKIADGSHRNFVVEIDRGNGRAAPAAGATQPRRLAVLFRYA
jgi:hypothetical protein